MMSYGWLVWDFGAVCVMLALIGRSARRGLVSTVIECVGFIASAVAAASFSPWLSKLLYEGVVRDALRAVLNRSMGATSEQMGLEELINTLPDGLARILQSGGDIGTPGAGEAAQNFIEAALAAPVLLLLQGICFFILFSVFLFVVRRISRMFTGLNRVPLVGTLNTLLGGLVGVVEAGLALFLLGILARLVIILSGNQLGWLNTRILDQGYIFRVFFNFSQTGL